MRDELKAGYRISQYSYSFLSEKDRELFDMVQVGVFSWHFIEFDQRLSGLSFQDLLDENDCVSDCDTVPTCNTLEQELTYRLYNIKLFSANNSSEQKEKYFRFIRDFEYDIVDAAVFVYIGDLYFLLDLMLMNDWKSKYREYVLYRDTYMTTKQLQRIYHDSSIEDNDYVKLS